MIKKEARMKKENPMKKFLLYIVIICLLSSCIAVIPSPERYDPSYPDYSVPLKSEVEKFLLNYYPECYLSRWEITLDELNKTVNATYDSPNYGYIDVYLYYDMFYSDVEAFKSAQNSFIHKLNNDSDFNTKGKKVSGYQKWTYTGIRSNLYFDGKSAVLSTDYYSRLRCYATYEFY